MKKLTIISFIGLFFIGCKKEYTCICTWNGQEVSKGVGKWPTKKDAQQNCTNEQNNGQWAVSPVVCKLE